MGLVSRLLPAAIKMQLGLFLLWAPSPMPLGQLFLLPEAGVIYTLFVCTSSVHVVLLTQSHCLHAHQ